MCIRPIRWLHLSDCHIGSEQYGRDKLFAQIASEVAKRRGNGWTPDFVFLTGDIAHKGLKEEYERVRRELLAPLDTALGGGLKERLFLVPGNHDVNRMADFSTRDAVAGQKDIFLPTAPAAKIRARFMSRFQAYAEFAFDAGAVERDWIASGDGAYAEIREVAGVRIGVVGLHTAWLSYDDHDRNTLTPGRDLLDNALGKTAGCDLTIVLGHHPIDWLRDEDKPLLRTLLADHRALYLHGHMHKADGRREDGAAAEFLTLQAGAAFQAHDDDEWRNGFLFGEADLANRRAVLEPLLWHKNHRRWVPDHDGYHPDRRVANSDRFWFPLPGRKGVEPPSPAPIAAPVGPAPESGAPAIASPDGWHVVDAAFLERHRTVLARDELLSFFDGRIPDWELALSPGVPRRAMVETVVSRIAPAARFPAKPYVSLLTGAGGEGKSTAFRQALAELVEKHGWKALWRQSEALGITAEQVMALPRADHPWLIATDDADRCASGLLTAVRALHAAGRTDVHFLLACRETDWRAVFPANDLSWEKVAEVLRLPMRGLTDGDAVKIVKAWGALSEDGLGKLADRTEEEAARALVEAARTEAADPRNGAFLGAMLRVRIGEDIKGYVRRLMRPLRDRPAPGGTLLDAYAHIAGMHAENLLFLSRPVLAAALGCDEGRLDREVIRPLVKEAMADQGGRYVFTRHRAIAETAMQILREEEWVEDADAVFPVLAAAARREFARERGSIPDIADWTFGVAKHFQDSRPELAIRVAEAVRAVEPDNLQSVVNLARILRGAGRTQDALSQLRRHWKTFTTHKDFRSYLYEWSAAAGNASAPALDGWLAGLSLADHARLPPPSGKDCILALAGLGVAFGALFEKFDDSTFRLARSAAGQMGLRLPVDLKARGYFEKYRSDTAQRGGKEMTVDQAIEAIHKAVATAHDLCEDEAAEIAEELADQFGDPWRQSYRALTETLKSAVRSPAR
ncbi:MAG: metallophosphoesterase [Alphaproteobacteria bacterium]